MSKLADNPKLYPIENIISEALCDFYLGYYLEKALTDQKRAEYFIARLQVWMRRLEYIRKHGPQPLAYLQDHIK